ncbi:MAG: FAD-dependent oxidoreductase [Acidimicrobiales bacterium]|nr:FAD-dependent oxidoreductase [Acidimicrobiales bacterium]
MRIAIVGSGIAGLTCAHVLGPHHDVTLFEASTRLGGHSNTVTVDDPAAGELAIDTGFIVHNDRNYPNLVRLFDELGVPVQDTEMSFGVNDRGSSFTYRATSLRTLFADRRNLVRPAMWRMLFDIARFYREGNRLLEAADRGDDVDETQSIGEFLDAGRYSDAFRDLHLIPMGSSVWSADPTTFDAFPAISLLRFLKNHGLLGVGDRPQWRTIRGGSRVYVDAIAERFPGEIRRATPVRSVARDDDGVVVTTDGGIERFDRLVLACHSDQALDLLVDPSPEEKEVLGAIRYQPNRATLHTDTELLSPIPATWSAWNYDRPQADDPSDLSTLTYDMTELQRLPGERRYLVSLNSDHRIDPDSVIVSFDYAHPVFDGPAIDAQRRFDEIDGIRHTHFCGAYWSYGFHEDGMASGLRVCRRLGVDW